MNAKVELIEVLEGKAQVKCAEITKNDGRFTLKVNHTKEKYKEFLNELNFNYDSGYGVQKIFGTVWLTDGTWCTRGEYDGSEWWIHNRLPEVPSELL